MKIKIGKYICYRYESKIKGGKCFIFNLDTGKIYLSSKAAFDILEFIEFNEPSPEELYNNFAGDKPKLFFHNMVNIGVLSYES